VVYERRGDVGNADEWEGWRVGNLRPVFEPVLWLTKPYKVGTTIADNVLGHGVGAFNEVAFAGYTGASDNVLRIGFESAERTGLHPMQKPLKLMEALISLTTQPGQLVLDPFAGSGSTLVAAHRLGRRSIGFEVDPEYCATAERRLDAAESQPGRNVSRQERLL
jgi:site-specific DNA-methyltransferase (adenine-specific)